MKKLKVSIVIDTWKYDIYDKHLTDKGYKFVRMKGPVKNTILLSIETYSIEMLQAVVTSINIKTAH